MHGPGPAHQAQFSFPSLFCTMEPEPVQPGMLIDVCKYLDSLQYRVWRKMLVCVESGERGPGGCKSREVMQGREPAELTPSSFPPLFLLPPLVPSLASFIQAPVPYSPSCPTAQTPPGQTLPFWVLTLGHLFRKSN